LLADGSYDTSFDGDGIVGVDFAKGDVGLAVALQPNGKIVVTGLTGSGELGVVRLNTNGSLDTSFDVDGKKTLDTGPGGDEGRGVAVQADGKIVIVGASAVGPTGNNDVLVVRLQGDPVAEPKLAYEPLAVVVGNTLVGHKPKTLAFTGQAVFTVTPALPAGLVLDTSTGVVSGIATATQPTAVYTVKLSDLAGSVTAPLEITVNAKDTKAPMLSATVVKGQRIVKNKRLFVTAGCNEPCTLTVNTAVTLKGRTKKVAAITATRQLKQSARTSFRIVFTPTNQRLLARLLTPGKTATATITITGTDTAGNSASKKRTTTVRR
jgi:uncharacterized delta-60 repeat protein